ncbi:hypothetical protein [Pseudoalteromonas sp.]|uniref:hypothetical protein n=1 Tax=Pseudoalteromonas sp. TaxID=53249 RepID=UPI003D14B86A
MKTTEVIVVNAIGIFLLFVLGAFYGSSIQNHNTQIEKEMHSEKQACEYVEKIECKQVWVRK